VIFDGKLVYGLSQTPQVWLDHGILEEHGELVLNWNAVDELFAPNMLDDMFEAYQTALTRLSDSTDWHHPFAIELPERQRAMRETFNQTTQDLAITRLEDPFFTQAAATPDAVAVATAQGDVTYRTVAQEALGICASLQRLGLKPQECVGVHLSKGWQQMAAIMGILRAGGAYVPLDPSLPTERLSSMASGMRWAISTDAQAQRLPSALRALCLHEIEPTAVDPGSSAELDALAYVIYTSGSTGKPKGVMIQHQAAMNTIADLVSRFGIGRQDRVLALSSLGFDLSVFDAFAMLGLGAKVVMPNEEGLREPDHWYQLLTDHQVTVWNSVPALMELLIDYVELNRLSLPCSLRLILLSGDWIATDLPARIARLLPNAEIISLGGATEASIWSIYYPIKQVSCDWQSIPYGYPLANQTYRVLNHDWVDCPEWVTGELYIGGAGVAAGYWQDEQQTAQRFVTIDGQRYYRTGDQGRFRPEGWIEFQGRNDHQVKIQGYRIEIAEIEAALRQHPNVTKSAVKVVTSASASRQLAAYVVSSDALAKPRATELSEFLQQRLPHYMIPATFTELDRLPLSSNSKIDYAALPEPKESASMAPAAQVPQTQTQQQVLAIIADVLGLAAVQPQQNLLDLGIDSIGMIRIANRIQAGLGIRPEIGQLYRMKTIHELIERCDQGQPRAEADARAATPAGLAPMITDPVERAAFKDRQTARRSFAKDHQSVALPGHNDTSTFEARKSQRHYSLAPLELESLSSWLSALRQIELNGQPKYLYASAGGLYPVQTYLFIKSGRVKGVSEGFYYYDPVDHRLVLISEAAVVHRQQFDRVVNQPIFDEAAFCVYFIASLSSIEPIYGEHSERFVNIEAGLMAQCLDLKAPELKIGVCHIGDVQVNEVLALLPEADKPQWLLCLLGGQTIEVDGADSQDAVSRLLNRVSQLTPEQVQDMLAAKRGQRQ
jgi:amino acid adenylation domain-containing protein